MDKLGDQMRDWQRRVKVWTITCFGMEKAIEKKQRVHRFVEEALELAQATECTKEEALELVEYVYGREVGERGQEMGGVMTTLTALANAWNIDIWHESEKELARCWERTAIIREKSANKPKFGARPQ